MCLSDAEWEEAILNTHGTYTLQPDRGDGVTRYTVTYPTSANPPRTPSPYPVVTTAEEAFAIWSQGKGVGIEAPQAELDRFYEMVRKAKNHAGR